MRCFLHLRGNPENLKRSVVSMINMEVPKNKSVRARKGGAFYQPKPYQLLHRCHHPEIPPFEKGGGRGGGGRLPPQHPCGNPVFF